MISILINKGYVSCANGSVMVGHIIRCFISHSSMDVYILLSWDDHVVNTVIHLAVQLKLLESHYCPF